MTTSTSSSLLKLATLVFTACSMLPVDGLVIPPVHNSAGMASSHHKEDPAALRPYSGFFRRSPHPADSASSSTSDSETLPSLLIPESNGRSFRVFGQAEFNPHIDSIIKRQAQGTAQTAAGIPGTLSIMDPSRNVTLGSLVLASATNATAFENSTASSFVLNAANTTGTELLLVPVPVANVSANATTMLVTMQISILDAASSSIEAYCATMNDDPGVPTQATMEPCMAVNTSSASTTGPFVVHKVQTFMYDFVTGVVTPQFQTTTTTRSTTISSSGSKRDFVVRQNPSSVAATSTPVSVASSVTSAAPTSTPVSVASSVTSAAPTSTLPVSAASSAKSSVASTMTGSVAPSAASATATVTSAATSATGSAPSPASTLNAVLVFVPSVAGEVAPHDEAVVMSDHAYLQDTSTSATTSASSTDSTSSATASMTTDVSSPSTSSDSSSASSTSASTTSSASSSTSSTASSSSTAAPISVAQPAVSMILNLIQMTESASTSSASSTQTASTEDADSAMTTVTVTDFEQATTTESSTAIPVPTNE